jgi:hypothetical protein
VITEVQIGSSSFGGGTHTLTDVTNVELGTNSYGYVVFEANYTFSGIPVERRWLRDPVKCVHHLRLLGEQPHLVMTAPLVPFLRRCSR